MSKAMALALFRQVIAVASLFGGLSSRIRAGIALAVSIADNWDAVWALIKGEAAVKEGVTHPTRGALPNGINADPLELMAQACADYDAAAVGDDAEKSA